ncbi:MAG: BPSS1780 family membrane protein [Rhizobacter sp.]
MKLLIAPPREGVQWARNGLRVFVKRPLSFMGLFGAVLLAMLLAQLLSWVGSLVLWACLPLVTLGFMIATRQALEGGTPTFQVFIAPLRGEPASRRALWQLGLMYAFVMLLIVGVHAWIDDGRMAALQVAATDGKGTPETMGPLLADARLQMSLLWFAVAASLLSVPFWHAPALVHWGGHTAPKALFSSTVACWRNKGAFLLYGLACIGTVVVFALLSSLLFAVLGTPNLAAAVMMPAVLFFTVIFYASLYFTYAGCFETPPVLPAPEEPTP